MRELQSIRQEAEEDLEKFKQHCLDLVREGHPKHPEWTIQRAAVDAVLYIGGCRDRQAALRARERDCRQSVHPQFSLNPRGQKGKRCDLCWGNYRQRTHCGMMGDLKEEIKKMVTEALAE